MRSQLLKELTQIQNTEKYINQDIMTFAGFLDNDELEEYIKQRKAA